MWLGDAPVATLRPTGSGIDIYYIHTDHLNTPRVITNFINNTERWRWDGEPFGGGTVTNNPSGAGVFEFGLRFPGQLAMAKSGLYYNYFRDCDPAPGRYVQSDPMGLWDGVNTYGYVHANPVSNVDPSGLGRATAVPPTPSSDEVDVSVRCGRLPAVMGGSRRCSLRSDGCKALECFKKMQSGNTPPPYYALWQNSNECCR